MLLELAVAAVIGLSFGNAWVCILMSFGTSSEEKKVGLWFILGRFIGLILLGSAISLLRFAAQDIMPYILLIFGISTILFGMLMISGKYIRSYFLKKNSKPASARSLSDSVILSLLPIFLVLPKEDGCRGKTHLQKHGIHSNFHIHKKRGECKRHGNKKGKYGFTLGMLRGATPCAKVIVLTPLLVAFGFPESLPLILVYASVSTVYPIMGYLSADILSKFESHRLALRILGALMLIGIGLYTILKVVMWNTNHLGT